MFFHALFLFPVFGRATTVLRADDSLYNPEHGRPEARDVMDYVQNGSDSMFARSFGVVMYTIACQPDRVDKLFKDKEDGTQEFTFYNPVDHTPKSNVVSFSSTDSSPGVVDFQGGTNLDSIKNRWWIAAAYTTLFAEWNTYYELDPDQEWSGKLQPTDKGREYDNAMWSLRPEWTVRPSPFPGADIDEIAVHWHLSALLRRNIESSYYSNKIKAYHVDSSAIGKIINHPPSIWFGDTVSGVSDPKAARAWAIGARRQEEGGSLSLSRPGLGEKSATIDLGVEESSFGAVLFYLQEWEEAWDPAIWYEREDAPTLIDQTTDPNAREAWMTSAFGHAAAASATGLSN